MPLKNWRKCNEDGEYIYTRCDIDKGTEEEDANAWRNIYDSFLLKFGIAKDYKRVLELKAEIALLQCDYVENDDTYALNMIRRLERELEELIDRPADIDTDGIIIHLEKWRGFAIDEDKITVRKFYKLLHEYKRYHDKVKESNTDG
jgi:hypothetical protein